MGKIYMKTFFGTLLHRLSVSNKEQLIWFGTVVFIMITLAIIHHKWKSEERKIRMWRMLCLLPLIIAVVHAFIYLRGFPLFVNGFFPLYVTALFVLLPIPFAKRKIGYKVTAISTTDDVHRLGIEDGTVITKWNGKDILQALVEDVPDLGMSVRANADRVAAMVLSGIGGDTIEIAFLDDSGIEQTATLSDLGEPHTQLEAFGAYRHFEKLGEEDEFQSLLDENFSTKMLDDKCGYLRVTCESSDNGLYDILVGYMTGNHAKAREMFREKLRDLKAQGMEYLVIDLRNNQGGYDEIANALCDLFTTDDLDHYAVGIRENGNYKCTAIHGIRGDGEFADLKVVALTNFGCLSAGDGASLYLSRLPDVTLAGLTDPYGCNQETGGVSVLSGGHVYVGFPVGLVLDGNGDPNIDTRADRISRNPVDERIPLDYDAAMKIFRDKEDYELEWAIQYLENSD